MQESPSGSQKRCVVCGEDCHDRPRVKDPRGRYYCQACYESARARRTHQYIAASESPPTPRVHEGDSAMPWLLEQVHPAAQPARACPVCRKPMAQDAVLCTWCGYSAAPLPISAPRIKPPRIEREPNWFLWPLYLFVRPKLFFQNCVVDSIPLVTALCAWMVGIASAIDRVQTQYVRATFTGRPLNYPDNWSFHWGMFAGGGLVGAAIMYAIGGWWYRLRVKWCGERNPEPYRVRRVYIFASLVWAIPLILVTIGDTMMHSRPSLAYDNPSTIGGIVVFICLCWSIGTSYVGVRTAFNVRRGAAIGWFIVAPVAFYVILIVGIAVVILALMFSGNVPSSFPPSHSSQSAPLTNSSPPQRLTAEMSSLQTDQFNFHYPADWSINQQLSDESYVLVESPHGATSEIEFYVISKSLGQQLHNALINARDVIHDFMPGQQPPNEGKWSLTAAADGTVDGIPYRYRIFIMQMGDDRFLSVTENFPRENQSMVEDGLQLIRDTVRTQH